MIDRISELREDLDEHREEYRRAVDTYKKEKLALRVVGKRLKDAEAGRLFIQDVAQAIQQKAHHQIASVVSRGLETIFDEPYTFKIKFEKKRGRTEALLLFERDGLELDPISAAGGGVIDPSAFTLRISCISLAYPPIRPVLFLDEPFKHVSKANGYLDRIPILLEELSKEIGIQIIMVTHIDELKVGKVVEMEAPPQKDESDFELLVVRKKLKRRIG